MQASKLTTAHSEAPVHRLLARLDGVHDSGSGCWLAKCPSHEDRRPSLSIRELDDGRILIHDFAGCGPDQVLAAIGFDLRDLFPEHLRADHHYRPLRPWERKIPAVDVLRAVSHEALVVAIAAEDVAVGKVLSEDDRERVTVAAARLRAASEEATCG